MALDNDGNHDTGICKRSSLLTTNNTVASAILTTPRLREVSCGFKGTSDGWVDLQTHHRLTHFYSSARNGNVVEVGRTALTGTGRRQAMTLVLGFGPSVSAAATSARMSLRIPRFALAVRYQRGWDAYLASDRKSVV